MAKKNLCEECAGMCCRYIALPIETPETRDEHDDIRWYLAHENISVFVEEGDWYISIRNKCKHLSEKDYKCMIYETRPKICRKYDTGGCDYSEGEYDYELHFTSDEDMVDYMKIKFDNNRIEKQKSRKKRK